jgi:hypothetical protein
MGKNYEDRQCIFPVFSCNFTESVVFDMYIHFAQEIIIHLIMLFTVYETWSDINI